jgi:signal transduction histidine kinase
MWPKPGTKDLVKKISYVKGTKSADGIDLVLGCGIYNGNEDELAKLEIH